MSVRRRILKLLVGLLVVGAAHTALAASPTVRVLGTQSISSERAAAILKAGGFPAPKALRDLQEEYLKNGRLFASMNVRVESDSSYTVVVDEGAPAHVRRMHVSGASHLSGAEVTRELGLEPGSAFDPGRFPSRMESLLSRYDADGYPFVEVWVDSIGVDRDSAAVDVALYVVEGTPRNVENVVVEGLKKTRPDLVTKIAGIEPGAPYRSQLLEDAYLRVVSSGVFSDVAYPTVRMSADGSGVDAVLHVNEPARSHLFAAALGYASASDNTDRVLSGYVQLELNNIGGSLKDFGATWNNDGAGRNETHIRYRDRLFLGHRLGLGLRLEQVGQDTLYTWQSAGIEGERGLGRVAGTLLGFTLAGYGDRNVFSEGDLVRSSRWRVKGGANAMWGSDRAGAYAKLGGDMTLAFKHISYRDSTTGPGDVRQTIYDGTAGLLFPAWRSLHVAVDGRVEWLNSDEQDVPLSEQFYLGGARTVRGYRENQFHGRRVAYARNELRLGRSARDGFYAFVDAGYVRQETPQPNGTTLIDGTGLTGYGFGVRSLSKVGRLDLSFAVSDGLSLRQTKVHVILEQNF
ncbi:MAG TPA: POTRA domain-containing protein [Candidatus Krumholzibacteria bacterium]|nr:POTRA domain-containing protein [Candidatus Krumholzibacteria bacterium]